ncbi:sugar transferase [Aurantibacter aestuarii]|uniref:Sugar transferase n=1 Tax=Aurantibacter aestuarii TaxID=1266046 RepID=A0A2T1NCV7_9FLAO|nr:sugar transferase [Aurantibacter aestuarii]PSG90256.1 sugar transferase [Aurantibacter aestuarii]
MKNHHKILKELFDYALAISLLMGLFLPIILLIVLATIDTKRFGLFEQKRVGYKGKLFKIHKIRTMKRSDNRSTITLYKDKRITKFGLFLRNYKLDELPQIFNILKGDMSFVGPRPDVQGYADKLEGEDRIVLDVKPGITGPAQLYFKNESKILSNQINPELYNKTIIWPKKVSINKAYIKNYTLLADFKYIYKTIFGLYE